MNKDLIFCNGKEYDRILEGFDSGLPYIGVSSKKDTTGYFLFFKKYSDFLRFKSLMGLNEAKPLFFA